MLYTVEAWSLRSPAASHVDRILTASVKVTATNDEDARAGAASIAGIPTDYWKGVRASAAAERPAVRWRKDSKGRRVAETVTAGHVPFVILRADAVKATYGESKPFNAPHLRAR